MKTFLVIGFFVLMQGYCFSQTNYPTENQTHIFWQPGVKPTADDYQAKEISPRYADMMAKNQFDAMAYVGIWSILDIPEKKKDRYKKFEKVYFAPAFDKTTSYAKTKDSIQIKMQNVYFDICEIWARWARKELSSLQDTTKSTGTLSTFYMTVKKDMNDRHQEMNKAYTREVIIDKVPGAFEKWRSLINDILSENNSWATSPEECFRLMSRKPVEPDYIEAPNVVGVLKE